MSVSTGVAVSVVKTVVGRIAGLIVGSSVMSYMAAVTLPLGATSSPSQYIFVLIGVLLFT